MLRLSNFIGDRSHFKKSVLGRDHINSIAVLDQLAIVFIAQAKYTEAESLYVRSIAISAQHARRKRRSGGNC